MSCPPKVKIHDKSYVGTSDYVSQKNRARLLGGGEGEEIEATQKGSQWHGTRPKGEERVRKLARDKKDAK